MKQDSQTDTNAVQEPVVLRLIYTAIFFVIFALSRYAYLLVVVGQSLHVLMAGNKQEDLLKLSRALNRYIRQLTTYITWDNERKPFPFSDWPSDQQRDDVAS